MKFKNHLAIVILMILGTVLLLNQVSQPILVLQTKADTEKKDDGKTTDSGEQGYILQENVAINSITSITLHQELYQIREIILDEVADPQPVREINALTESDHFRTLFRKVISPNAP